MVAILTQALNRYPLEAAPSHLANPTAVRCFLGWLPVHPGAKKRSFIHCATAEACSAVAIFAYRGNIASKRQTEASTARRKSSTNKPCCLFPAITTHRLSSGVLPDGNASRESRLFDQRSTPLQSSVRSEVGGLDRPPPYRSCEYSRYCLLRGTSERS